jgi:hypothetical protein
MIGWYILVDEKPVPCTSLKVLEKCLDHNSIEQTRKGDVWVSTVFLGSDRGHGKGHIPILFETMIFGGKHDQYQERYCTIEEARAGHKRACKLAFGE